MYNYYNEVDKIAKLKRERVETVRHNASVRMKGTGEIKPLPEIPKLKVWLLTNEHGEYGGVLPDIEGIESKRDAAENYRTREFPIVKLLAYDDKYFCS